MSKLQKLLSFLLAMLLLVQIAVPARAEEYESEDDYVPTHVEVPLYLQTDYPDIRYGSGTIKNSGCGIVCLSMVATYLTGHEYLPDELADYFGGRAENNITRMEYGAEKLGLPYEKTWYFHETVDAVRAGKVAIVLMENDSIFTDYQHFVVFTGATEDGKIMVNDPYEPNYDKWNLKHQFRTGFTDDELIWGFSGAWIFDKSDMPEEPFIYSAERRDRSNSRYEGVKLTSEEMDLLARVVWVESRGEPFEGQQAIAEVVLNRLVSGRFSSTLSGVIYGENQFRSVPYLDDAEPNQTQYEAIEAALYGPNVLPMDVYFFSTGKVNENVWGQIGGHVFCYHFDYVQEETEPEDTASEDAADEEIFNEELIGEETADEELTPEETVPEETVAEEIVPEETVPEETIPEETVAEETVPEEAFVEETAAEEPVETTAEE